MHHRPPVRAVLAPLRTQAVAVLAASYDLMTTMERDVLVAQELRRVVAHADESGGLMGRILDAAERRERFALAELPGVRERLGRVRLMFDAV